MPVDQGNQQLAQLLQAILQQQGQQGQPGQPLQSMAGAAAQATPQAPIPPLGPQAQTLGMGQPMPMQLPPMPGAQQGMGNQQLPDPFMGGLGGAMGGG